MRFTSCPWPDFFVGDVDEAIADSRGFVVVVVDVVVVVVVVVALFISILIAVCMDSSSRSSLVVVVVRFRYVLVGAAFVGVSASSLLVFSLLSLLLQSSISCC